MKTEDQAEHNLFLKKDMVPNRVKGVTAMTAREHQVCRYMINAGDDAYEKTAKALDIEPRTVKSHMKSVRTKIGFRTTMGVLIWLQRWYHVSAGVDREQQQHMPVSDKGRVLTLMATSNAASIEDNK